MIQMHFSEWVLEQQFIQAINDQMKQVFKRPNDNNK